MAVDAGLVLRRAIVAWGLGHALLRRPRLAAALLAAELLAVALVGALVATLADTTWYLVPFIAGSAFLVAWTAQAVHAYRAARRTGGATPPAPHGSPAASAAWLTVPLLAWGTAFWLIAATAATPAAVLDRFVTAWPEADAAATMEAIAPRESGLSAMAEDVLDALRARCRAGDLAADCDVTTANLLRDVRVRVVSDDGRHAEAMAERVRYQRRPARLLGLEVGTELVPVPIGTLLTFELEAEPAPVAGVDIGARRWTIVNADAP